MDALIILNQPEFKNQITMTKKKRTCEILHFKNNTQFFLFLEIWLTNLIWFKPSISNTFIDKICWISLDSQK